MLRSREMAIVNELSSLDTLGMNLDIPVYCVGCNACTKSAREMERTEEKPAAPAWLKVMKKGLKGKKQVLFKRLSHEMKNRDRKSHIGPTPRKRPTFSFQQEWKERIDFVARLRGLKKKKMKSQVCQFSIEDLKKTIKEKFSVEGLSLWGEEDLMVVDKNGEAIFYYLRDGLRRPYLKGNPGVVGLEALEEFTAVYPPPKPKKTDVRHKTKRKHPQGHGVHHLALWHGVGHKKDPAILSSDIIGAGHKFNKVTNFLRNFTPVIQSIGGLFFALEPREYEAYRETFMKYVMHGSGGTLQTTERNCFLGMAVLTGLCCNPHRDSRDALDGWVADLALGEFEGGHLEVPQIGHKFVMKQGTIVFMKSALLQHSVSKVTSGKRYAIICFSHEAHFQETFKKK